MKTKKRNTKKRKTSSMSASSAVTVVNIEDLLKKFLLSLPFRSRIRFKCVSRHWLSLISGPDFNSRKISAFLSSKTDEQHFKFIPALDNHESSSIDSDWNPFKTVNKEVPVGGLDILQSCNGLFLCGSKSSVNRSGVYDKIYVVNPTTNQFRALTPPGYSSFIHPGSFMRHGLAFEPSKSPHYKVVSVCGDAMTMCGDQSYQVYIYWSETNRWKRRPLRFRAFPTPSDEHRHYDLKTRAMSFDSRSRQRAVYNNGAIHWIRKKIYVNQFPCNWDGEFKRDECDVLHYFDVNKKRFRPAHCTPPVPQVVRNIPLEEDPEDTEFLFPIHSSRLAHRYFGSSGCRLYLIEILEYCSTQFEVMEMEMDYSAWVVKYYVDLDPVLAALSPHISNANFVVLNLSRDEQDQEEDFSSSLLLHIPGKVVSCNLLKKTYQTSVQLTSEGLILEKKNSPYTKIYPYMESLASA